MRDRGLSLIELMLTLAIASIVLAAAIPAFSDMLANHQVSSQRDLLFRTLHTARSAAVLRNTYVTVCPGTPAGCDDKGLWERGWLIFEDPKGEETCADANGDSRCDSHGGAILKVIDGTPDLLVIRGNHWIRTGIRFNSRGYAGWNNGTFSVCHRRLASAASGIVVARTGRPRVAGRADRISCP